ncbi:MAG: hypothetical protein ACYDA3_03180 [Gaiellaceae bacterium]
MRPLAQPTWRTLLALVGVSAVLRAWASGSIPTPWIAPDELIYADLGRSFWQTGHFELFGHPVALFSAVYPVLAGLPLSLHDRVAGYETLKILQAVAMSLTAVPVFLWGRELVPRKWALVAATLALALPSLAYSGLVMTEVAFYPTFVVAAWTVARSVAQPTRKRQALALAAIVLVCATRLQAILFLPAYLTAVGLDAVAARDRSRLRAHLPVIAAFVLLALAWSGWQLRHGGPVTKVLGAYQAAGETGYAVGAAARFVLYHLGDLVLISGFVPFCALIVLGVGALRGSELDAGVRALVATTLSLTAWMTVEVGVFASRQIGHLAERNLFPLVPLLLLALVVRLARGARPTLVGVAAAVAAVLLLVAMPLETLTTLAATPSSFTQIPLLELMPHVNLDLVVPLAAALVLALCALLPRRVVVVGIPVLLLALGVAASVSASRFIVTQAREVQFLTLGSDRTWIDDNVGRGSATYLSAGDLNWEIPWQARFWNAHLGDVVGFLGRPVVGLVSAPSVGPGSAGTLGNDRTGTPLAGDFLITSTYFTVAGSELMRPRPDIVLWNADQPLRLLTWLDGVAFDGTVPSGHARLYVYACGGGTLTADLSAVAARVVNVKFNAAAQSPVTLTAGGVHQFSAHVPAPDPGNPVCFVDFTSAGLFTLENVGFARAR